MAAFAPRSVATMSASMPFYDRRQYGSPNMCFPQAGFHQVDGRRRQRRHQLVAGDKSAISKIYIAFSSFHQSILPGGCFKHGGLDMLLRPIRPHAFWRREGSIGLVLEHCRLPLANLKSARYLRRGSVRKVPKPYSRRTCPAAVFWPNQASPKEVVPVADKSGLAPVVLIELEPFGDRSREPFRRILLIIPKVNIGEIEVECSREHEAVFVGNGRKETGRIINIYFVRIEPAPPVSGRRYAPVGFEYFPEQLVAEGAVIMADDLDLRISSREVLYRLPSSIDAIIVKHEYPIAPP
jgi:hypothetical protein